MTQAKKINKYRGCVKRNTTEEVGKRRKMRAIFL